MTETDKALERITALANRLAGAVLDTIEADRCVNRERIANAMMGLLMRDEPNRPVGPDLSATKATAGGGRTWANLHKAACAKFGLRNELYHRMVERGRVVHSDAPIVVVDEAGEQPQPYPMLWTRAIDGSRASVRISDKEAGNCLAKARKLGRPVLLKQEPHIFVTADGEVITRTRLEARASGLDIHVPERGECITRRELMERGKI